MFARVCTRYTCAHGAPQMDAASVKAFVPVNDSDEPLPDNDTTNYDSYPDSVEESGPLLNQDKNDVSRTPSPAPPPPPGAHDVRLPSFHPPKDS